MEDRMEVIQRLLDSDPVAYKNQATLVSLLSMLGLGNRSLELDLRIASCAWKQGDKTTAAEKCLHLVHAAHSPAWELCAELVVSAGEETLEPGALKELLGFAVAHCHEGQVRPSLRHHCSAQTVGNRARS